VRNFLCPNCRRVVFFESFECDGCGTATGYSAESRKMVTLPHPKRRCANHATAGCNWVMPEAKAGGLCPSCLVTRTRPNDADLSGDRDIADSYIASEGAKRRLVFQLLELGLPLDGLGFDLLASKRESVTIGHVNGIVTIDLAEFDDAHRERLRQELGEPYRTLLGHMRHEVGHFYWEGLAGADVDRFRELFGDERADYTAALERHYRNSPVAGWSEDYVSAYAAAHPWEDWAETFAHYLHIRDTLQTAAAFGVILAGPSLGTAEPTAPSPDPQDRMEDILADWIPLASALNAINRSMGHHDAYPFVLSLTVMKKLGFVHKMVLAATGL